MPATPVHWDAARSRSGQGRRNYLAGIAAESGVERAYLARGLTVAARRWRGRSGEIDLVVRDGAGFVFVEVKRAKTHDAAALRVGRAQIGRLMRSGQEFCDLFGKGSLTDMRFDLATVDAMGRVVVLEAAFWENDAAFAA